MVEFLFFCEFYQKKVFLKISLDIIIQSPVSLKYHQPLVPSTVISYRFHTVLSMRQSRCLQVPFVDNADTAEEQPEHPQWNHE